MPSFPLIVALLLASLASPAHAATNAPTSATNVPNAPSRPTPPAETRGQAILQTFCDQIGAATTLSVRISFHVRMEDSAEMTTRQELSLDRPTQRYALRLREGNIGLTLVSNGRQLFTHAPFLDAFAIEPAPPLRALATTPQSAAWSTAITSGMGGVPIVQALLATAPCTPLTATTTAVTFLGSQELDGERCHFIRFDAPEFHWTAWITDSPTPLIRKIVPVFNPRPGQPRMQMSLHFTDWALNQPLPEDSFAFNPPPDADEVASVLELLLAQREEPLTGKPLPAVELHLLSGEIFRPATAQKDRQAVILYFWSLRDERTIQGLFQLASLAPQLRAAGILLCAVNVSDTRAGTLQAVLRLGIDIPVAADPDGEAAQRLGISSVPWTLIVKPDGTIARRIIGLPPDFRAGIELQLPELSRTPPD